MLRQISGQSCSLQMDMPVADLTQVQTFLSCPEKYRLRFLEGLKKIQEDAHDQPRKFGEAIHRGIEAYYAGLGATGMVDHFLSIFPKALTEEETVYTPANGNTVLRYFHDYAQQNDAGYTLVALEKVLEIQLAPGIPFSVKPDRIVRHDQTGYWAVDTKTTGKALTEDYWRQYENAAQVSAQAAAVTGTYGQCSGVIIEAIRLGYRSRMYKGEPAGFYVHVQRQIFNRTTAQLDDWKQRALRTLTRLSQTQASGDWEKNTEMCHWCEYSQLCQSVGDEQVRETLYQRVEDPYSYLKRESLGAADVYHT